MSQGHSAELEDLLHGKPLRDTIQPPVVTRPQLLPFHELSWEDLERLCTRLVASQSDVVDCHRYGVRGDFQCTQRTACACTWRLCSPPPSTTTSFSRPTILQRRVGRGRARRAPVAGRAGCAGGRRTPHAPRTDPRRLLKNPPLEKPHRADAPLLASRRPELGKWPQELYDFCATRPTPWLGRDFFRALLAAGLDPGRADSAVKAALRHDLIVEEDGNFRLAVPLMRRWIRLQSDTRDTGARLSD